MPFLERDGERVAEIISELEARSNRRWKRERSINDDTLVYLYRDNGHERGLLDNPL